MGWMGQLPRLGVEGGRDVTFVPQTLTGTKGKKFGCNCSGCGYRLTFQPEEEKRNGEMGVGVKEESGVSCTG